MFFMSLAHVACFSCPSGTSLAGGRVCSCTFLLFPVRKCGDGQSLVEKTEVHVLVIGAGVGWRWQNNADLLFL